MVNDIIKLENGDFEVLTEKKPYEFARDRSVEKQIAEGKKEKVTPKSTRNMEGDSWLRGII